MHRLRIGHLLTACSVAAVIAAAALLIVPGRTETYAGANGQLQSGVDTVAIMLLSSTCPACTEESLVKKIRQAQQAVSEREGNQIRFVGVALDQDLDAGLELLQMYGPFDEVAVGSDWTNTFALEYVWKDSTAFPMVPQMVVIERELDVKEGRITSIRVLSERKIRNTFGLRAIAQWLEAHVEG